MLVIIVIPLIWLGRAIMKKYYPQSQDSMAQDVTDDTIVLWDNDLEELDYFGVDEIEEDVVRIDPVIAAMRQEEEELAREQQDSILWEDDWGYIWDDYVQNNMLEENIDTQENITQEDNAVQPQESVQETDQVEEVLEEVIDVIELDADHDGEIDTVATIHTTAPADLIEAKRQKSIEMLQFELRNLKEKWHTSAHEKKLIEARALHPERDEFTTMLAEHYYEQSEYKKSLWLYRKMVDADSSDDKSLAMIANCYIKLGEWENAQVILEKLVQDRPENPRYWMSLAEVYYNFKQLDQTIDCVRTMVKLRPTNMDYLSTLAQLYHETQNYEPYVQILYRMLELDPLNHEIKAEIEKYS